MGLPLSKLVVSVMEDFIEARHKDSPQQKTARENDRLREENAKITKELRIKTLAIDKLKSDIARLRQEIESKEVSRRIDLDIVKLFMTRSAILKDKDVLTGLNFDELNLPRSSYRHNSFIAKMDMKIVGQPIESQKIVYDALCNLQDADLIEQTKRGWRLRYPVPSDKK